jgi:hypothetical protein
MPPVPNLPSVSTTPAKLMANLPPVLLIPVWCTLACEYLREFLKKFETVLMGYSGAGGKLIYEKKPEAKNLLTLSI